MSWLSRFFGGTKKKYVKSPIDGKVLTICAGTVDIDGYIISKLDATMIQIGQVVHKGEIIGFRK